MSLLTTGTSALLAFQRTLDTISHNVANANTPGYSRQHVDLAAAPGVPSGFGNIGIGVKTSGITRSADSFQLARGLNSTSELGRLDAIADLAARVSSSLTDAGTGLAQPWASFFDTAQVVASQPSSTAARQALLGNAGSLVSNFHMLDAQLTGLDSEINSKLTSIVTVANGISANIANLNLQIVRERAQAGGQEPNDLMDQRELLVSQLGSLIGATTLMQDDGAMNVFLPGGQAVVVGSVVQNFTTLPDSYRPGGRLELGLQTGGTQIRLSQSVFGGQVGGFVEFRNTILDPAAAQLGRIAINLVDSFNTQHQQGMDQYGNLGGDFFSPLPPITLGNLSNTGSATLAPTLVDPANFDGNDVVLSYNGASWAASSPSTGAPVAMSGLGTPASPLRVGGVDVVVSGAAASGDRFLLQAASGAASRMQVAITDPAKVAAAKPIVAASALSNLGLAQVAGISVDNVSDPALLTPAAIVFTTATTYTLNGGPPLVYNAATGIAGPGWTLTLTGAPLAGDRFDVRTRGAGSSDNSNALVLAKLGDQKILSNGSLSLHGAVGQLAVQAGFAASQSESTRTAQQALNKQITSERQATSGVNLDEEAANLVRFQQAYQAAAHIISISDSLFQSILGALQR